MTNYLNVLKPEAYLDENDAEKTSFLKVGVAFPHESGRGFNLKITSGIACFIGNQVHASFLPSLQTTI